MATILPARPRASGAQPARPSEGEWASFVFHAALKVIGDEDLPITYATKDAALFDIHRTLNWAEAHGEYEWPDFTPMGLDFNQTLRHQRQLASDVFNALLKDGKVQAGSGTSALDTLESEGEGSEDRDTKPCASIRRMAERKRRCQREEDADIDLFSDNSNRHILEDDEFLAKSMRELIHRSGADVIGYLESDKNSDALANIVHDGLVSVWEKPVARHGVLPEQLQKRRDSWAQNSASKKRKASPELEEPRLRIYPMAHPFAQHFGSYAHPLAPMPSPVVRPMQMGMYQPYLSGRNAYAHEMAGEEARSADTAPRMPQAELENISSFLRSQPGPSPIGRSIRDAARADGHYHAPHVPR